MGIVADLVKKTKMSDTNAIVPAGTSQSDQQAFRALIVEAEALRDSGDIEILEASPTRIRFKRLK